MNIIEAFGKLQSPEQSDISFSIENCESVRVSTSRIIALNFGSSKETGQYVNIHNNFSGVGIILIICFLYGLKKSGVFNQYKKNISHKNKSSVEGLRTEGSDLDF